MAGLDAFLSSRADAARFSHAASRVADLLERHLQAARTTYPEIRITDERFAAEIARRLAPEAGIAQLAELRAADVYLAIACADGDAAALRRLEDEFLDEVDRCGARVRATPAQTADVGSDVRRLLLVTEPGRPAAVTRYSGKGDLRAYVRVIATRELMRAIDKGRREVNVADDILDRLSPVSDPELVYLRDHYRADVDAALRTALASLAERPRALLRYHLVRGWSIDQLGELYGVHRATAARWVAAAREELGDAVRQEVARRLSIQLDEVASIVRLVQTQIDVSLSRLFATPAP